jgi:hypothetical protein
MPIPATADGMLGPTEHPSDHQEALPVERTMHDNEGERDNPRGESAQAPQAAGAGATGAAGPIARQISEAVLPPATDYVVPQPLGPRHITEPRAPATPVVQDARWQYDPRTKQGKLTCSGDPAHAAYGSGPEKQAQRSAAVTLVLRQPECDGCEDLGIFIS